MPIILDGTTGITTPGITNTGTFVFQGPVQVPAGSAATASITTAAGANTGIFFPSSSSVAITTAGTQRFVVSAAGNVGIGTATPTTVLNYTFATINGSTGAGISLFNSNSDAAWIYATSAGLSISTETASPILFKINAATRATLDASGNLGIGTSSPTDTGGFGRVVDVQGSTGAQVVCRDSDDTTKFARLSFDGGTTNVASIGVEGTDTQVAFRAGGGEKMRLDASGNLGLGVTPDGNNLAKVFQLESGVTMFGFSNTSYNSANAYYNSGWKYKSTAAAALYEFSGSNGHKWYYAPSGTAGNTISFTQAMTLDASGNLGVGTASPDNKLEVAVGDNAGINIEQTGASQTGYLNFRDSDGALEGRISYDHSNNSLRFTTSQTERARITSAGVLCIGTTSGNAGRLVVSESGNPSEVAYIENTSGSFNERVVSVNATRNTTNGTYKFLACSISNVAVKFEILDSGTANNSTGTYGTISDQRLKQDIVDAGSQWDDIKSIRFRKYRMKTDVEVDQNAPSMLGVVAQELEEVCPGLVADSKNKDGSTIKTVKSSILLMKAAVALQEAMARIEVLEADMAVLKGSN